LSVAYWLANASLFVCGAGTFVFHALSEKLSHESGINPIIWDYVTMALVVTNTSILFFDKWMKPIGSYLAVSYLLFAAYSNDSLSYAYLYYKTDGIISFGVQYPAFVIPFVCMFVYCCYEFGTDVLPLVLMLLLACSAWIIDRFSCWIWFGHSIWHICIAYASILFICFGLRKRAKNRYRVVGIWWPVIEDMGYKTIFTSK
jgi:hypothetical protein